MTHIGSKRPLHSGFACWWASWILAGVAVTAFSLPPAYSAALAVAFFPPELWAMMRPSIDPVTGHRTGDTLSEFLSHVAGWGKGESWFRGWPALVLTYVVALCWRIGWLLDQAIGAPREWWWQPIDRADHVLPVVVTLGMVMYLSHHIMEPRRWG